LPKSSAVDALDCPVDLDLNDQDCPPDTQLNPDSPDSTYSPTWTPTSASTTAPLPYPLPPIENPSVIDLEDDLENDEDEDVDPMKDKHVYNYLKSIQASIGKTNSENKQPLCYQLGSFWIRKPALFFQLRKYLDPTSMYTSDVFILVAASSRQGRSLLFIL
jgi:hypothetical protein